MKNFEQIKEKRNDFPIFNNNPKISYLDNAATTQKPKQVIKAISEYYNQINANVHRGIHYLSEQATTKYENARYKVKQFINAESDNEIIFTSGTTDSINLVANSISYDLKPNENIVVSIAEHHSNFVPWQQICQRIKAEFRVADVKDDGLLDIEHFKSLIDSKTKLVAIAEVSNVLGLHNDLNEIIKIAHHNGAKILIDAAQSLAHHKINVQTLNCDFLAASAHKIYGPTGLGFLYAKKKILQQMKPYRFGGEMIEQVNIEKTTFKNYASKFEAGTPNIAGTIGLKSAIDYIDKIGFNVINEYESYLTNYCLKKLEQNVSGIKLFAPNKNKHKIITFSLDNIHPHDLATIVDNNGVAIRAGFHCAMPLMNRFKTFSTCRASLAFYNNEQDIDNLCDALVQAIKIFS